MTILECPLCCAEVFSDVRSLENHLLDLSENIVCPICESQFMTIQRLASHLNKGCESECGKSKPPFGYSDDKAKKNKNQDNDGKFSGVDCLKTSNISSFDNSISEDQPTIDDSLTSDLSSKLKEESAEDSIAIHNSPGESTSDSLYSCSVCEITFTSVERHLNEFHLNENVLVHNDEDAAKSIVVGTAEKGNTQEELCFSGVELLPKDASSVLWTSNDVKSLLIVNWESNENPGDKTFEDKAANKIDPLSPSMAIAQKSHWIESGNYFFYSPNGNVNEKEFADKVFINEEDWQSPLDKYPLATFVSFTDKEYEDKIICENKSYLFNGHRVRLLKLKRKDGGPSLECIPFSEEPPETIVPVLEKAHLAPVDLEGTYAVMWPCHLCGALAYHWCDLAKHLCSSSPKYFPCSLCKKTFHSRRSLNNHYSVLHKIIRSLPGCFPCSLCSAKVQTSSHLEKHLAMHKKNDLVKCNVCESMVQKSTYTSHLKAHEKDGSLSLVCQLCNRPFKCENDLNLHIPQCHLKAHEQDNLKCVVCRTNFSDINALREHMVLHGVPIKPHLCTFCPKSYYRLIDKVIHERVHTKSRPHSCDECGRCFRLRHSLVAHMRIHTGEKPFQCSLCDRTFRTKHLQRSHLQVHNSLHQFRCRHCNKQFRSKGRMEIHEKSHKKPYACGECKRVFYSLNFAKKHMENHQKNELNFTCSMCPNMFTRAAYLETHLKKSHGLDTVTSISISTQKTYEQMEESFVI